MSGSRRDVKKLTSLVISLALVCAVIGVRIVRPAGAVAQSRTTFDVEEATIASIHAAITSGQTTCRGVVQAYIDRAKAYNGVCTALLTSDGADVAPTTGYVRAGAPLRREPRDPLQKDPCLIAEPQAGGAQVCRNQ